MHVTTPGHHRWRKPARRTTARWWLLAPSLLAAACGESAVERRPDDAGLGLDADADVAGGTYVAAVISLTASILRFSDVKHPAGWRQDIAYVDVKVVLSSFPHQELASGRIRHKELVERPNGPCKDVEDFGPFVTRWNEPGMFKHRWRTSGPIDAVGAGYAPQRSTDFSLHSQDLLFVGQMHISDLAAHGTSSATEPQQSKVDLLVQAYDWAGSPLRPRRFCGHLFPVYHYETNSFGQDPASYWYDAQIITHSIGLPLRHAIPGTFPACPADVVATCGDNACIWPEDEVNCALDCHWIQEPSP